MVVIVIVRPVISVLLVQKENGEPKTYRGTNMVVIIQKKQQQQQQK